MGGAEALVERERKERKEAFKQERLEGWKRYEQQRMKRRLRRRPRSIEKRETVRDGWEDRGCKGGVGEGE